MYLRMDLFHECRSLRIVFGGIDRGGKPERGIVGIVQGGDFHKPVGLRVIAQTEKSERHFFPESKSNLIVQIVDKRGDKGIELDAKAFGERT